MATTTPIPSPPPIPLSLHDCPGCGKPVSPRQDAIGEALLKLAAAAGEAIHPDIRGDCTPLYCVACIDAMLDDDERRAELTRLEAFMAGLDALLARP